MSAGDVRGLTRRGYEREDKQVWREVEPAGDSAPSDQPRSIVRVEDWGVTRDEAAAMLRQQMCPACGRGPWKSPLMHVSKAHGIPRRAMREACGMTSVASVVSDEYRGELVDRGKERDMSDMIEASRSPRKRQEWTEAGIAAVAANLSGVTPEQSRQNALLSKTPEAVARQADSLRAWWAEQDGDPRNMPKRSSAEQAASAQARWNLRGRQPCGTRAAYRRGCRCDDCRAAYLAYRSAHG